MIWIAAGSARGASLDLLEVGGPYGTPGATNPTALWWNPAGLAVNAAKIQFFAEAAPAFGRVIASRDNPDYGEIVLDPEDEEAGWPTTYDYSGTDRLSFAGVVPFLGVQSSLGVKGLGLGLGLAVPTARGGGSDQEWGANRYALRDGNINAVHLILGGGYQIRDLIAFGASVSLVNSSWYANTDASAFVDLARATEDIIGAYPPQYQDAYIEDRAYSTTTIFGGETADGGHGALHARTVTFGLGTYVTPTEKLGISVSYNHGMRLNHTGDLTLKFECPPEYDTFGRLGAESVYGLCDRTLEGEGAVSYNLPSRMHLGVVLQPIEILRLEAMGAYVFWSAFRDYEITTSVDPQVFIQGTPPLQEPQAETAADLVSQELKWARDNQNTFWLGVDGKVDLPGPLRAGARVIYDHHAIPDRAVSANNIDFDALILGAMAEVQPMKRLGIGLSYSRHVWFSRDITNSAFAMSLDPDVASPGRYFYPSANGDYSGSLDRLSIFVRGRFGSTDEL